jgi:hypothetical protein
MKNLFYFESFVKSVNESVADWDPKRAQTAIDEIKKRNKDADPVGLSFANIQKVFGKIDYPTRFAIAQALLLAGKNLFPTNKYYKDKEIGSDGIYATRYIGEKDQNLKMDKVSEALLRAVKPIVDDFENNLEDYFNYKVISQNDKVKQAKVAADKISG